MRRRPHVNPLQWRFQQCADGPLQLPPACKVEVELGCADAAFLFERVKRTPHVWAVGLEIRRELVDAVNRQAKQAQIPVCAVWANINTDLANLFPRQSVARLFINFPDPWFKKRHHKRRLVNPELVTACLRCLRFDGEIFFQSDVFDVALDALAVFEGASRLVNMAGSWRFWKQGNPYGAQSRRERFCEEEGKPIWRVRYGNASQSL